MKRPFPIPILVLPILIAASILAYGVKLTSAKPAVISSPPGPTAPSALCPPLDPPAGPTISVSTIPQLQNAVNTASPGDTILVADGTYNLNGVYLRIDTPNVTLRSASGHRDAVILDGNYITTEIIQIVASNVTVADLTLGEAYYHPIHIMSSDSGDTDNTLIYNVHIVDAGEQAIKINPASAGRYTDDGTIACSYIELTGAGRPHIRNNCYTGGIDAHQSQGWLIRDNLIEGFWCQDGLSEHGIHLWRGSRDTLVERNILNNNARGIGFGLVTSGFARTYPDNPCPAAAGGYVDHYDGLIRNNFVFADQDALFSSEYGFDCGICIWQACGAQVFHNSVVSTQSPFSSIEWRFDNTDVEIKNNLLSHNLRDRGGTATLAKNLENTPLSILKDGPNGDLHLRSTSVIAIDQAIPLAEVTDDIDGDGRPIGSAHDIGADEYGLPIPAAVTNLRLTTAITGTSRLTATLRWTPPANAMTITLRYAASPITENTWPVVTLLLGALPGTAGAITATIPYTGDILYFNLRSQNAEAAWSDLSNNAFWPTHNIYQPLLLKNSAEPLPNLSP